MSDSSMPTTRRRLLAGTAAAVGVTFVGALQGSTRALAATGGNLVLGHSDNTADADTVLTSSGTVNALHVIGQSSVRALLAESTSSQGIKAVSADAEAIVAESTHHFGVSASSTDLPAVNGSSTNGHGVAGGTHTATSAGVYGTNSTGSLGVAGISIGGSFVDPGLPDDAGVYGYNSVSSTSRGVSGLSYPGDGVRGQTSSGAGVHGVADGGSGLFGTSQTGKGLDAVTNGGTAPAALGRALNNKTGVQGYSGSASPPSARSETGVLGTCNVSTDSVGVFGSSVGGTGVHGLNGGGAGQAADRSLTGVYGFASDSTGVGVWGDSSNGTGMLGTGPVGVYSSGVFGTIGDAATDGIGIYGWSGTTAPPNAPAGTGVFAAANGTAMALRVSGKASFSRSGRVVIAQGKASAVKTLAGVTTGSMIIATLQKKLAGTWIIAAVPAAGKFTVYLNKSASVGTSVAFFVLD
jgi:hypothetical protein